MRTFKVKLWIGSGVIVGSIIIAAIAMYYLAQDLGVQADAVIADKARINQQTAIVEILARLKNDAPVAADYSAAMAKLLPPHDNLINFPQWIVGLGKSHNLDVAANFQGSNAPVSDTAPGTDSFTMTVTGTPGDIAAFLKDLETQSQGYLLSVDSFSMSAENAGAYQLSAQGRVFSQ